jgi:putative ABC transport system substrate-binding protein
VIVNRRESIAALVALGGGSIARAQPATRTARIGVLSLSKAADASGPDPVGGFARGLHELGWDKGRNVVVEERDAAGNLDRLAGLAAELVALKVDVIVAPSTPAAQAAMRASSTIPIVFAGAADPVTDGLVASLARPGGNATGLSNASADLVGKRLELLKQAAPKLSRVAVLWHPAPGRTYTDMLESAEVAARALGMQLKPIEARDAADLDRAFGEIVRAGRRRVHRAAARQLLHRAQDHSRARCEDAPARGVYVTRVRRGRRPDGVRCQSERSAAPRGGLRRSHPEGRASGRPAGRAGDEVRAVPPSRRGEGAGADDSALAPAERRRRDPMSDASILGTHSLGVFALTVLVVNATPGVDMVLVLTRTLRHGVVGGIAAGARRFRRLRRPHARRRVRPRRAARGLGGSVRGGEVGRRGVPALARVRHAARRRPACRAARGPPRARGEPRLRAALRARGSRPTSSTRRSRSSFLALLPQFIDADAPAKLLAFLFLGAWFVVQGTAFWSPSCCSSRRCGAGARRAARRARSTSPAPASSPGSQARLALVERA